MTFDWKKVAMIMLVGLLVFAGPTTLRYATAANTPAESKFLNDALAAQDKATKAYNDMMKKMDSMMKMPMSANEKSMMSMMQQMADVMKMLLDANKALIDAVKSGMEHNK
jgi:hypothetical protein